MQSPLFDRPKKSDEFAHKRALLGQRRAREAEAENERLTRLAAAENSVLEQVDSALAAVEAVLMPDAVSRVALLEAQAKYWRVAEEHYPAWKAKMQAKRELQAQKSAASAQERAASKQLIREVRMRATVNCFFH